MELRQYFLPLLKWWWLIVAATVIATASSLVVTMRQPAIYRTGTAVSIGSAMDSANPKASDIVLTQELANTYADVANRNVVRKATMVALGLTWLPAYTVRVVPETQLLEITVTDSDPARAQAVANGLAAQLIAISPGSPSNQDAARQEFINNELRDLEVTILATKAEIEEKQAELGKMFSARQIADTQTQIAGLQNKLLAVQANYSSMLSNSQQGATNRIKVIEPAELPTVPIGPNRLATVLLAAAIGFVLAAGVPARGDGHSRARPVQQQRRHELAADPAADGGRRRAHRADRLVLGAEGAGSVDHNRSVRKHENALVTWW